jgi:hypothetical protein
MCFSKQYQPRISAISVEKYREIGKIIVECYNQANP